MKTKSIKQKVLTDISKRKQVSRCEIQKFIWKAQNKRGVFKYRQGYYCDAIISWVDSAKLIERISRGNYKITQNGKDYIANPNKFNKNKRESFKKKNYDFVVGNRDYWYKKAKTHETRIAYLLTEIRELKAAADMPSIQECIEYFEAMEGNYSGDTHHYMFAMINQIKEQS
jgi:hypothetical protein